MKKKLLILLLSLSVLAVITACGSKDKAPESESKEESVDVPDEPEQAAKEPTDLTGTWESEENDGTWIEAVISDGVIEINWVSDGGDTKSIYWIGTYEAPTEYVEEYSWTSERDKEKTDTALLASTDDTKKFVYEQGEISYEASMLGTTTTVHLAKK